jgi:hypothetical protein
MQRRRSGFISPTILLPEWVTIGHLASTTVFLIVPVVAPLIHPLVHPLAFRHPPVVDIPHIHCMHNGEGNMAKFCSHHFGGAMVGMYCAIPA